MSQQKEKKSHYPPLPCGCNPATQSGHATSDSYCVKLPGNRRVCTKHAKIYELRWVECKTVPIDQ